MFLAKYSLIILHLIFFLEKINCLTVEKVCNGIVVECHNYWKENSAFDDYHNRDLGTLVANGSLCDSRNLTAASSQQFVYVDSARFTNGTEIQPENSIRMLHISFSQLGYLPSGIMKIFPKLEKIYCISCGLKHLEKNDMRQFGNDVTYADFRNNSIKALLHDLFEHNENLKTVNFRGNPLKFIDPRLLLLGFDSVKIDQKFIDVHFDGCSTDYSGVHGVVRYCTSKIDKDECIKRIGQRASFFINEFKNDTKKSTTDNATNLTLNMHTPCNCTCENDDDSEIDTKNMHDFFVIFFFATLSSIMTGCVCWFMMRKEEEEHHHIDK